MSEPPKSVPYESVYSTPKGPEEDQLVFRVAPYGNIFDREEFDYNDKRSQAFNDVYLDCEGHLIGAHKIILAARSPFYRDIIRKTPMIQKIDLLGMRYVILLATTGLLYGEQAMVKEFDMVEFATTCNIIGVTFSVKFVGHRAIFPMHSYVNVPVYTGSNTVSSGSFPLSFPTETNTNTDTTSSSLMDTPSVDSPKVDPVDPIDEI